MARDTDHLAGDFETENTGGFLSGLLAEEENFDRRSLLRLGAWGVVSVGAVIVAVMTNQSSIGGRREQVAATDFARQSQQIQSVAKESQNEARRLASAIETLNGDRDRLYSRVTVLEQGLDSATGAIARQNPIPASPQAAAAATTEPQPAPQSPAAATVSAPAATSSPTPAPPLAAAPVSAPTSTPASASVAAPVSAPVLAPVATTPVAPAEKPVAEAPAREQGPAKVSSAAPTASPPPAPMPATSLVASKSIIGPPDPAAGKLIRPETPARAITSAPMPEVVASTSDDDAEPDASQASPNVAVQRTEFGVDVGGANSLNGLRALWRGLLKSNSALALLRPVIAVKEGRNGLGLQLRLVAGPLNDAAAAAKICAALTESQRSCETTVFDGQRLAMKADEPPAAVKPAPAPRRRGSARHGVVSEEAPQRPENPTLSSLFTRRQ
jgi:hypothetical protein